MQSQYQQALAAIPALEQQIAAQENLISVLLGRNPGPIPRGKRDRRARRARHSRPTCRRRCSSAGPTSCRPSRTSSPPTRTSARRKALYFPTISLTGAARLGQHRVRQFPDRTGAAPGRSPPGSPGPIFTVRRDRRPGAERGGRRSARRSPFYQQTILNAFRETNDALIGTVKKREESPAQAQRVAALREYARLSRLRFDNGYAGYLEVLYAENELFARRARRGALARRALHAARQRLQGDGRRLGGSRPTSSRRSRRAWRRARRRPRPRTATRRAAARATPLAPPLLPWPGRCAARPRGDRAAS